jgi:hypothetical protein
MAVGYATRFYKRATSANFDGSATAKTLWLTAEAISAIWINLTKTADETAVLRGYWRAVIEMFTGATDNGTVYSGGAWSEVWSGYLNHYTGATATKDSNTLSQINIHWNRPLKIPAPFKPLWLDHITGSATLGQWIFPNTHTAAPVATETDLRLYFTNVAGDATNIEFTATVLVPD